MLARSRAVQRVGVVSSLWDLLGFRSELVAIDLLHTLDLGCATFAAGSLLAEELREPSRGANKQERLAGLSRELQAWHQGSPQRSQLHELAENMIQASGKAPTLAATGAELRYLIGWLDELASSEQHRGFFPESTTSYGSNA